MEEIIWPHCKELDSLQQGVVKMQFGSHVYGTNVATSDTDFKGVYIPKREDILLQRVENSINKGTGDEFSKNTSNDVDIEIYSLQRYLWLLCQGQTVAVDMLFVPDEFISYQASVWKEIQANAHRLIPKNAQSFVGYCRTQANKYGIKGSRMASVKSALVLIGNAPSMVLRSIEPQLRSLAHMDEFVNIVEIDKATGEKVHLEVCGRKFPLSVETNYAADALNKIYDNYGERARKAESNEGIDWKAIMHAIRILDQTVDLFLNGEIIFPRPKKEYLLRVRNGEVPYKEAAKYIEDGILILEDVAAASTIFPDKSDLAFADSLVLEHYGKA